MEASKGEDTPVSNQPVDRRVLISLVLMAVTIVVLGYFVYLGSSNSLKRSDIVIVNTSELMQKIINQSTELNAGEAADLITSAAEQLASQGKIVIRQEAAWGAPEGNYLNVQE